VVENLVEVKKFFSNPRPTHPQEDKKLTARHRGN